MTQNLGKIYPGKRVRTLFGEFDTDHNNAVRETPPGTWGHVSMHNHADHWDVTFPSGAGVVITESELLNAALYQLAEPSTLEQCALALRYGQDVCELTFLDDQLINFTEEVAGDPSQVLELVGQCRRHADAASQVLAAIRQTLTLMEEGDEVSHDAVLRTIERIVERATRSQHAGVTPTAHGVVARDLRGAAPEALGERI